MADNRYRPRSPPGGRRYHDPSRSSTGMFYSSSYDPNYPSHPRSAIEPPYSTRHGSIYDTRPVKSYTYKDDAYPGGTVSRTEYAVRPRTNSTIPSETRRPMSMIVKNTSPTRRPVVSATARDDNRSPMLAPHPARDESRYLVPASSHGRDHHRRQYSATQADVDRLSVATRGDGRPRSEYHLPGGYSQKSYADHRAPVRDDDFSYTGPREQFNRDMQARPAPVRDPYVRRERPVSVMEVPELKPSVARRERDQAPASSSRPVERLDRPEDRRLSRPVFDKEERLADLPQRRQSVRAPVVHQLRDEGYSSSRDDIDIRSKPRRDRVEEEEPLPKHRPRDVDRDHPRERDLPREPERERERERERDLRDRERDRERDYERERPRPYEKAKHPDDRRELRSRENSPERSGLGKGIAASIGGAAVAGLAGTALKGSSKAEEADDSDAHKERRHRKHKHRGRDDADAEFREPDHLDRKHVPALDDRAYAVAKRDESASESFEDEQQRRRHRRRKHKDREELDVSEARPQVVETSRGERELPEPNEEERHRRRHDRAASRNRETEASEFERRTISPGEDEDSRPRRVQLVEPERKEELKPKGILKAPRTIPFPEDPNPTREGVAPLKEASKEGKDGIPQGARWTKISRMLVNPEALESAKERFEERDEYVIVLRVVTREEIEKFAEKTKEIRDARGKQWQEELDKQSLKDPERPHHHDGDGGRRSHRHHETVDDDDDEPPQALLDQKPAVPGLHPRDLTDPVAAAPAPVAVPVPDIKLEHHDAQPMNYSDNV